MRKRLCFPATNRVHLARQSLLLEELRRYFDVDIFEPKTQKDGMASFSILCAVEFNNFLRQKQYDFIVARGDRFEILPIVMVSAYLGVPIVHIEGGDLSGAIDNKVRHAITQLADYHFCTNEESHKRLITAGVPIDRVWNFGSLDVEFARTVIPKKLRKNPYLMVVFHPIDGEDENEVAEAVAAFPGFEIVGIASNKDYGRQYGNETYSPEDYINLMRYAHCLVGNSSSLLKEASILGTPVVNVGSRQEKRLKPKNVLDVPCESQIIKEAIEFQTKRKFEPDLTYFQENTSKKIANKLNEVL